MAHDVKKIAFRLAAAAIMTASCMTAPRASLLDKLEWKTEKHFGKATQDELREEYGFIENPLLLNYLGGLGQSLASVSHRTDIPYEFSIVDTGEVNAFAAPGGFVFVTRGLLDEIDSDDELAAVVGHEVGHVAAKHGAKNIKKIPFIVAGMNILYKKEGETAARIGGMALSLLQLHYSREDEYQSDQLGVQYSLKAGYDPEAMVSFFQKLEKKDRTGELTKLDVSMMSHPRTTSRMDKIKSFPELNPANAVNLVRIADSYRERFLYHEAVARYEEALAADPKSVPALAGLGASRAELGNFELARDAYNRALALSPDDQAVKDALQRLASAAPVENAKAEPADELTAQAAHDNLTEAVMRLERKLVALADVRTKAGDISADVNRQFDRALDGFSSTASSISDTDQDRVEILNYSAMVFSTLLNTLSDTTMLAADMETAARDALRRGRIALYRMERGTITKQMASGADQLALVLMRYDDAIPELEKTIATVGADSRDVYAITARAMTDLADTLSEREQAMVELRARGIMENMNNAAKNAASLQQDSEDARDKLEVSLTSMRRAAMNMNALSLDANEERIYAKMFARRFKVETGALTSARSLGLGYGDVLAMQSLAVTRGESLDDYLKKFTEGKRGVEDFLSDERDKSAKTRPDRSLDILIALAEMDMRSITRENLEVNVEPPAGPAKLEQFTDSAEISADPDLAKALDLIVSGKPELAIDTIQKRGGKPATATSHKLLGIAFLRNGMYDEALGEFKSSLKKNSSDPQAHLLCAGAFAELERYDDAINEYKAAGKADEKYAPASLGAAYSLVMLGKSTEAEAAYKDAIAIEPASAEAHRGLGLFYYSEGRIYEALQQFDEALKSDPSQTELSKIVARIRG